MSPWLVSRYERAALVCASLAVASLLGGCTGGGSSSTPATAGGVLSAAPPAVSSPQPATFSLPAPSIAAYDRTVLGDNPVSFYRLNDTASVLGDAAPGAVAGAIGSAVHLGTPSLTSTGETSALFPGGTYDASRVASVVTAPKFQSPIVSVEAWVSPSSFNTSNRFEPMVAYGRFSTGTPYHLTVTPINQFYFSVHTATGSPSIVARTTSAPGHVYHLVGTYDGSMLKLYVNGVLEGQGAATGAISYFGIFPWSGLAIGSGFDALAAHPIASYAGTIGDVATYNYALGAAQVTNHYLTGVQTPAISERPAAADSFVNTIGVDAPFNYQGTSYDTQYSTVKAMLVASGIRHIRAGLAQNWPTFFTRLNDLAKSGIHSQLVTSGTEAPAQILAYPAKVQSSIEAFEGPNEPDLGSDPNWAAHTRAFMHSLYSTVKGNAATRNYPVVGSSIVTPGGLAAFGNDSADLDYGNIHPYYGMNNPGTTGTGSVTAFGRSGSTAYFLGNAALVSGTKPLIASETGFGTGTAATDVSEKCDGKETPRTFFAHFKAGITRTLTFQFVESGTSYGALGPFSYMGLLRQDLTPKPSYTAIKSLISLLSDPGGAAPASALTYSLGGNVNNVAHALLQKGNGTYYLALWLEVPSWDVSASRDIDAAPQTVTLTAPGSVTAGSVYTFNDAGVMSDSTTGFAHGAANVNVSDRITIIAFHV